MSGSSATAIVGAISSMYGCVNGAIETAEEYKKTVEEATKQFAESTGEQRQLIITDALSVVNQETTTPDIERDTSRIFAGGTRPSNDLASKWIVPGVFGLIVVGGLAYALATRKR